MLLLISQLIAAADYVWLQDGEGKGSTFL